VKTRISEWFYDYEGIQINDISTIEQLKNIPDYSFTQYLNSNIDYYYPNLKLLQDFLKECSYVSDEEHFGKNDFWMLPNSFENEKKGDCEDFAIYTWRQLYKMGYDSRLVIGTTGKDTKWHAWCTAKKNGKAYLIDPVRAGYPFLLTSLIRNYQPHYSFGVFDNSVKYYYHSENIIDNDMRNLVSLIETISIVCGTLILLPILFFPVLIKKKIQTEIFHSKIKYL
jgi:hypothetical protein